MLHSILGFDVKTLNPEWMLPINEWLQINLGIADLSFWGFMIGGNLLALIVSLAVYPVVKPLFNALIKEVYAKN